VTRRRTIAAVALLLLAGFTTWRFVRPMNIFVVSEAFERPISTTRIPTGLTTLSAEECGACHREMLEERRSSIHHAAWTDPYFQVDFRFDGSQQIFKNCHTPLDRQQDATVLGFHDAEKWHPILAPNPDFDRALQSEGVTCAVCHVKDGAILGAYGSNTAPHPVRKLTVSYFLVDDKRRRRIGYEDAKAIGYEVFHRILPLDTGMNGSHPQASGAEQ
jgi:hypothetical protein